MSLPLPPSTSVVAVAALERLVLGRDLDLPPCSESLPSPPAIVVGIESVNAPFASSMRMESLPSPTLDVDRGDVAAREREVGRAVVADVDLDPAGIAGLQAKRDRVAVIAALDVERAVLERGPDAVDLVVVRALAVPLAKRE